MQDLIHPLPLCPLPASKLAELMVDIHCPSERSCDRPFSYPVASLAGFVEVTSGGIVSLPANYHLLLLLLLFSPVLHADSKAKKKDKDKQI